MRNHSHFGGPPADYQSWPYATDADTALAQLDDAYASAGSPGSADPSDDDLARPCGPAEGPYADYALSELILHINREVIHHGAEIACLRDLYAQEGLTCPPSPRPSHVVESLLRRLTRHTKHHADSAPAFTVGTRLRYRLTQILHRGIGGTGRLTDMS